MQWPELPTHWEISIDVYTIIDKYVLGRTYKVGRGVLVLVGLFEPLVRYWIKSSLEL